MAIIYLSIYFSVYGVRETSVLARASNYKWRASLKLHYCYSNLSRVVKLSIHGKGVSMP